MHHVGMLLQCWNPRAEGLITEYTERARCQAASQAPELKPKKNELIEIAQPLGNARTSWEKPPEDHWRCDLSDPVASNTQASSDLKRKAAHAGAFHQRVMAKNQNIHKDSKMTDCLIPGSLPD